MNKTAIKNFAIWARNKLIADVSYAARLIGVTEGGIAKPLPQSFGDTQFFDIGTAEPYSISGEAVRQRDKLIEVIRQKEKDTDYKTAYRYVMEEVAYTWFNRLIAIRFMEVNDYLPSHIRVLSSESGKLEPDLVTTPFDAELPFTAEEEAQIFRLKQDNRLDEVFRILFLKQCNALNAILPALFETTKNYTELLLSLSVIDRDGVVYHLIHDIPEADFNIEQGGQVEIIGWLYQYYNTELKAAIFAKNGKITKEEIPAVTQLFTPDWIVRYMVENSLGRLWVEGHPDCGLEENWKYYLEEAEQETAVQAKLAEIRREYAALNPEDIKLIDPCMGSGHILVYAFDVLLQIYESAGYSERDAAKSILEHNLYGLDIDDRAYQLAYFAVMMKARQYNRRILNGENTCHVYAVQESNSINRAHLHYFGAGMDNSEKKAAKNQLEGLLDTLTDAKEYGSILNVENYNWDLLRRFVAAADTARQISMESVGVDDTAEQLNQLIDIGETLARKYSVVVTNPPYMASSGMNAKLSNYLKETYPCSKGDLFAVFIEKCRHFTKEGCYLSLITQQSWMFLSSYEKLREYLSDIDVATILHLGAHAFEELGGEVVQTVSFVIRKTHVLDYITTCDRLVNIDNASQKEIAFLSGDYRVLSKKTDFELIPAKPYAYWISEAALKNFKNPNLGCLAEIVSGMTTGNNEIFLRVWTELNFEKIAFNKSNIEKVNLQKTKWIPYHKGGGMRKWYGNQEYVVNWSRSSEFNRAKTTMTHVYLKPCITWSDISGNSFAGRYCEGGFMFDVKGSCAFAEKTKLQLLIGIFNSKVTPIYVEALNPTTTTQVGDLKRIPLVEPKQDEVGHIQSKVMGSVDLSKAEWDSFESSWDFKKHPLFRNVSTISEAFNQWNTECDDRFNQLKANEEELNRIFIDTYGLQDELTPEVEDKDVTVRKADLQRDIKSLLGYAVGCMFGRYSLDTEGLAYAGGAWDSSKYRRFIPDEDNVIPITDEEYLEDDIVSRLLAWLKAAYGADTLEENLDFIAKALGTKGSTSREIIRNYFLNDFFKDHCQTYSVTGSGRRPIYWLFDSGKQNGFKALIYLHRYTPDTIGNLRIDYLHKMQRVYESEINRMQDMMEHSENAREVAAAGKRKEKLTKQLKECREYDEKISHLALSRIELDLDDGVKVNYRKLQTAQDGKFYEVLSDSKNIMAKQRGKA
ncbi:hypothetical protein HMPREF9623_00054 [Stomatobaculum longum]|uniref:site-specific DNA-methyltransferase (adenine-specific) n=1 Tax=Stomatobaculum longum TaxID=796942 RepID=A0AA36Y6X1_9FIRM|nr:BREX-1 system adenine-specific DNA-methyltransferase PglX [Stomatobaculum longum]EHO18586.1 hypothetical protein HMPREF9623_00054 [Stomatobaculum longum]